jgi:hypothetical protein
MGGEMRRRVPVLLALAIALVGVLGGSVYAATRINGHIVRRNSLPGNRVAIGSLPANRLRKGSVPGDRLVPGSVTGDEVDASTLGRVLSAVEAEIAGFARTAGNAKTAETAVSAESVDGLNAGCPGTHRLFAGACWQIATFSKAMTAPAASVLCAAEGGSLPDPLQLSEFSHQSGVIVPEAGEWTNEIATFTGRNAFSVITVVAGGAIDAALSTELKRFRCVLPLIN